MTRYSEIADDLISRIRSGKLPLGGMMPGELQLMQDYDASRHTIREALRRLEKLGLVERRRGMGTRVLARSAQPSYVHRVASPGELLQYPPESRLEVSAVEPATADRALARVLGCRPGSRWVRVTALRGMGRGVPPICVTEIYLLPKYAAVATQVGREGLAVYQQLERRFGLRVAEVAIEVLARPMPREAAGALGVEPGSPSMTVVRRYFDDHGVSFQVSVSEHPGDRYTFSQRLKRVWEPGAEGWSPA